MLLIVAFAVTSGCATKEYSYLTKVSGGEQLRFTFVDGRPAPAKGDGIKIIDAGLRADPTGKRVFYEFHFIDENAGESLRNVRVEDVSEEIPILLFEDPAPKLDGQNWRGRSRPFGADDPEVKWVSYLAETVRVLRFTITTSTDRTIVLHQVTLIPAWMKGIMRSMFGQNY